MKKTTLVVLAGLLLSGCGSGDIAGVGYYNIPGATEYLTFYIDHASELNLTEKQEKDLRDLRENTLKDADHRGVELRMLNRELRDILKSDNVDTAGGEERIRTLTAGLSEMGIAYVKAVAEGKRILTTQQLKTARELQDKLGY